MDTNIPHGTENGYGNHGCRCELCRAAKSEAGRRERAEKQSRPATEIPHGTGNGYENYGCRCDLCRAAEAAIKKERRHRAIESPESIRHGTRSSYQSFGCRCSLCVEADREYNRKRREANPKIREDQAERSRRWRERHPDRYEESRRKTRDRRKEQSWEKMQAEQKVRNDAYRLRSKGIEAQTEAELLAAQNGVCAICGQIDKTRLSIDHCHTSGRIRGLLCRPCNLGLGCFKDDVERLKKAIEYLEDD